MELSTRGRYAVMAMVDLAAREIALLPSASVSLAEIAQRQQLSQPYLEQLFAKLRRAGLVCSTRGPGGGYRLARTAADIAIAAIVAAVEEPTKTTRCEAGGTGCLVTADPSKGGAQCQTHDLWVELGRQIDLFLNGVSLADVVSGRVTGRAAAMAPLALEPAGAA
jgi:Rrf2 family iron-sulfur cluster assembly transcriptional regulator